MQPENKLNDQPETNRRSFIEQARRAQIVEATIDVLAEHGHINTSFVRIARHAGISPSLISYHFKNKEELWREVLQTIITSRSANVQQHVAAASTYTEKVRAALEADLIYMGTRPKWFAAFVEVFFTFRTPQGQVESLDANDDHDPDLQTLVTLFREGQTHGEFGTFDPSILGHIIAGAKDRFLAQQLRRSDLDLEVFTQTLVKLALTMIHKEEV